MVIAAVKDHPDLGFLADEAYAALTLEPDRDDANFANAVPMVLPDLLTLMDTRTAAYSIAVPGDPGAEITATIFLAVYAYPAASPDAGQSRTRVPGRRGVRRAEPDRQRQQRPGADHCRPRKAARCSSLAKT